MRILRVLSIAAAGLSAACVGDAGVLEPYSATAASLPASMGTAGHSAPASASARVIRVSSLDVADYTFVYPNQPDSSVWSKSGTIVPVPIDPIGLGIFDSDNSSRFSTRMRPPRLELRIRAILLSSACSRRFLRLPMAQRRLLVTRSAGV